MVYCKIFCKCVVFGHFGHVSCDWLFNWENWNDSSQYLKAEAIILWYAHVDGSHGDIGVHEMWSYGTLGKYMTLFLVSHSVFRLAYAHLN